VPGDSDSDVDDDMDDDDDDDDDQFDDAEEEEDDDMIVVDDEPEDHHPIDKTENKRESAAEGLASMHNSEKKGDENLGLTGFSRPRPSLYPFVATTAAAASEGTSATTAAVLAPLGQLYEYAKLNKPEPEKNSRPDDDLTQEAKPDPVMTLIDKTVAKAKEATASNVAAAAAAAAREAKEPASSIENVIKQMVFKSESSEYLTSATIATSSSADAKASSVGMEDGSFAPRNVTMNVKDLPHKITSGATPLPGTTQNQSKQNEQLNTITKINAASIAAAASSSSKVEAEHPTTMSSTIDAADSSGQAVAAPTTTTSATLQSNQEIMQTNAEGRSVCGICQKVFQKPSQLRMHVNIHYMERPFKCNDCAVSFRTKGHLVKHERSAGHFNKVNINQTFGAPSSSNPRPFKCMDCLVKFRIHGHLAKHLRSKIHIMKLECTGKLPIGIFADMERLGTNLNEIDTTDCKSALKSLQEMAEDLYRKDPSKLPHLQAQQSDSSSTGAAAAVSSSTPDTSDADEGPEGFPEVKSEPETVGPAEVPGTVPMRKEHLVGNQVPLLPVVSVAAVAAEHLSAVAVNGHVAAVQLQSHQRWGAFSPTVQGKEDQSTDSENVSCLETD
jgi:hypothetical protein